MLDRNWIETALTNIEAVISGRITADVEKYEIDGQNVTKIPMLELFEIRKKLQTELATVKKAEDLAAGLDNKNKIRTRF